MPIELLKMTLEAVLRTYSSVKGHRTICEREIENLFALLGVRYSSVSEERIKDRLKAQRLINLEIPVLVRSLKSSNVELG